MPTPITWPQSACPHPWHIGVVHTAYFFLDFGMAQLSNLVGWLVQNLKSGQCFFQLAWTLREYSTTLHQNLP